MFKMLGSAIGAAVLLLTANTPAAAGQYGQLAEFTAIGPDANFEWIRTPGYKGNGTLTSIATGGQPNVNFQFTLPGGPPGSYPVELQPLFELNALGPLPAVMTITSTQIGWGTYTGGVGRPAVQATFSFTYAGDTPFEFNGGSYAAGANLLTLHGALFSPRGGGAPSSVFTSDFLDLSRLTSVYGGGNLMVDNPPPIVVRDGSLAVDDFLGRISNGQFYAGVPETSTWAMMITGFGLTGAAIRRRRTAAALA